MQYDDADNLVSADLVTDSSKVKDLSDYCIIDSVATGWGLYYENPFLFEYFFINNKFPKCKFYTIDSTVRGRAHISELVRVSTHSFRRYAVIPNPKKKQTHTARYLIVVDSSDKKGVFIDFTIEKYLDGKIDTGRAVISVICKDLVFDSGGKTFEGKNRPTFGNK